MEKLKWIKKGISALLALNMVLSSIPLPAFAATTDNLCDHHPVHTDECGYVEAVEGSHCTHVHDDTCGYTEAREEVPCTCEPAEDGIHQEDCGYAEAVEGSPCTHSHDELCGYAEAVEGQPCGYECGECAAAAEAYSDLGIGQICAAGNGDSGLGNWVNGEGWNIGAESNIMTEVNANVYEITYTDLPASDNYLLKFAADGTWEINWGGTYIGSGVESDAVLGGSSISFPVSHEGSDVTLKLDLTGYDPDTQTGATFTVTVIPPEGVPVCTCEVRCDRYSVNSDCAVCAEDVNGCTGREEAGYTYDEETNTYTVTTANGLFAVAELVDGGAYSANITLAADIVLNENLADKVTVAEDGTVSADDSVRKWMPIADRGSWAYSGTFDGGGHTITGLYSVEGRGTYGGLIEWLAPEGTVKNLKIRDFCLEGTYSGAIAGQNEGKIIGCSISGTGIFNGSPELCGLFGGIVCENLGQVTDCSISANLSLKGAGEFGGIAYSNGQDASIIGCSNSGTLTGTKYVGGIVSTNYGTVTGCSNSGTVTGTENVGGIVGSTDGTVSGCYNTGTVIGKAMAESSEASYVGGIAGVVGGTMSGCYNIGSIDSGGYSGGIAAFAMGTYADCFYLSGCVKSGSPENSSADGITEKSAAQFASGEVAYLLNGDQSTITYRQTLGSDAAPSFTGGTVYRVGVTCTENAVVYANSQDTLAHNYVNNICTACGEVCDHSGSTHTAVTDNGDGTHSFTCTVCGDATEEHAFDENGTCVCGINLFTVSGSTLTIDGTLGGKPAATEEDITVLVNKIKECLDQGITTIIVSGSNPAMIDMVSWTNTAIGEAIYRLSGSDDYDENNLYNGKIDLILPDVTEIVDQEFYSAWALNSITLPKVIKIGDEAFHRTWFLKTITFESVLTEVNETGGVMFAQVGKEVEGCDLILNCGQMNESSVPAPDLTNNIWKFKFENEFKSITLTHSYGDWVSNGDGTHTRTCANDSTHTENGDCSGGEATCTAPAVCITCGTGYGERKPHSFNDSGFCTVCNTAAQAKMVANSDGTVTYFATLPEALAAEHNPWDEVYALADYEEDITIPAGLCFYGENHTFSGDVSVWGGLIFSGTFNGEVQVYPFDTGEGTAYGFIYGGTFRNAVFVGYECIVYGGTFEAELELGHGRVHNFAGDEYHFALGENFTLMLDGNTTVKCEEHFEPLRFDCTVGKLCRLCWEALTAPQTHTGSNSTCNTEGACQVCGTLYLDPDVHADACTNGIWTCCGKYQIPEQDAAGVYEIDNAGKLFWFAAQVNSGNAALNARLTADIDLENRAWTPIGNDDIYYKGSFDGSGKTIKGLYIHDEAAEYVGLFGAVYLNAHVKAVTLTESSVTGASNVGGIAGLNRGTVTGCVNNAVVSGSGSSIGGIAGENSGTVELCGNTNTVTGSRGSGGIVGRNSGTIRNCYNTGEVRATNTTGTAGGITHLNMDTVEYSWSTGKVTGGSNGEEGGIAANNTDTVRYCCATQKAIDSNQYGSTSNNVGTYTAAQFASGEVAYMLSSASEGELVWGQTIGTDPYPVLGGAQVYHGYTSCGDTAAIYTNDETVSPEKPAHTGEADYTPIGDGKQHIARWSCCGTEVTEAHSGGTATCRTPAVCQHCGESYGELDPDNHEYETNNGICCDTYQSAALNAEGFYEIFNAGQLYWFAQQVNIAGDTAANGKLMADIDLENRTWYPIGLYNDIAKEYGSPVQKQYVGTFDGNNHTVSNFTAIGNGSQGLFGYCNESQTQIKNLGVINATVSGWNAGAVAGYCANLTNCYAVGCTITGASDTNTQAVTISSVGGNNGATVITNCWAYNCKLIVGEGEANYVMHPVGGIRASNDSVNIVQNCYYGEIVTDAEFTSTTGATEKTEAQFASGEVAYLLGTAWGQTIGTDSYPVLGGAKVYEIKVCEKSAYSNTEGDVPHDYDENGFCTATPGEIHYQPAPDSDSDGFFEIGNAGQLFWFANHINTVDRTASAVLTADIDLEGRPWTPIGSTGENSNNFRGTFDGQNYTIKGLYVEGGRAGLGFFGEVRTGTVKNFTIYGEVVANTEVNYVGGVIGSICGLNSTDHGLERNGAIIQNITSYVNLTAKAHGIGMIGGFVGYANHQSLIEQCAWYGTFDAGEYRVDSGAGGFIGKIQENTSEVTIRNCGAYGTIKTNYAGDYNNNATIYMGGFLSFSNTNAKTTLENCLFAGRFERGENLTDEARLGAFGTLRSVNAIKNCYYLGDDGLAAVHSDSPLKPDVDIEITAVTGEQLKSGEIAYKLQEVNEIWGQTIGTQNYPVLGGDKVYQVKNCKQEIAYNNSNADIGHNYANGICTVCGEACEHIGGTATCTTLAVCAICGVSYGEVSTNNHDETVAFSDNGFCPNGCYEPAELVGSYYQITNAGQLYWFAAQVNSGYTNINGELKANIVVNENVLTADGEPNGDGSEFRIWTPIGTADNAYIGDFCGLEHTVSGLYFNESNAGFVGLFGYVRSGSVNHVGVIDSYFNGSVAVGGVVGCNNGTVEYAYNTGTVKGSQCVGGVVGDNQSTVKYAYNTGTVSGDFWVGGVVGDNQSTVKYAYNTGSVSGAEYVGGVAGENYDTSATVTNCYFDSTVYTGNAIGTDFGTATDVEGKTTEQFASGEVAYLLGSPFGQAIGTHLSPLLYMGDKVYYGYTSCGAVQMVYTNDPNASTEKPEHTGEATYTLTEDGAQHIAAYDCCGSQVIQDHTYENGKCVCGLYDLWVAGEQITDSHLTVTGTTGTATYDPATDTLTLNGFDNDFESYSFTNKNESLINAAVYSISDLNVVLTGENCLGADGFGLIMGICSDATLTIGGDGAILSCPLYSANGTIINGGTLDILGVHIAFDGPSTTINGGSVNVSVNQSVTYGTLTVNGGRVVLENSDLGIANNGTILIGEGMAVYDENGALIENPDFKTLQYALIQAPCDHTQATPSYSWTEDPITLTVTVSCTACGETFTGSTEDMDVTTSEDGLTTTYTASVTLNGKTYTDSKTVTNQVTSVNIAWGSMEFTYTEDETGEGAWGSPDGANRITVTNTGTVAVTVTAAYTQAEGYEEIEGKFFASENSTHTEPAPAGETAEFYLYLEGEPAKALKNTTVGTVTISIR